MKAIILGASGLTGSLLLEQLIVDDRYKEIILFNRKELGIQHTKITEHIVNLFELEKYSNEFVADHVFCCIGTTKKKTPDTTTYRNIDFGIPTSAAKLSRKNGITSYAVVSAIGANANSSIFYNKTKGEMEQAVLDQNIPNTIILRPSLITGNRKEFRNMEKFATVMFKALRFLFIGPLKKYRAVDAVDIAKCMIVLANSNPSQQIIESQQIETFLK